VLEIDTFSRLILYWKRLSPDKSIKFIYNNHYHMFRRTKQREAILKVLRATTSHPTADWIYDEVRKEISNISLGTVYRNLKLLRESGEILEIDFGDTFSRFDGNPNNHYHFRCEKCGRIFDVDEPVNMELDAKVAQKTGFEISYHRLEFRGLCKECQKAAG
jgi:Fe2+ or Zn2+ uptake regulation protein